MRISKPRLITIAITGAALFGTAACGSGGGQTQPAQIDGGVGAKSDPAKATAFLEKAKQVAADASAPEELQLPSETPAPTKGKSLVLIPCASTNLACKTEVDMAKTAAESLGWKTLVIDGAGDPTKMNAAVERAINIGANAVFTVAIDAATIPSALAKAKSAGLKLGCSFCVNSDNLYDFDYPAKDAYELDGYHLAAKAFVDAKADLKAVIIEDDEFAGVTLRNAGIKKFISECKDAGASCETLDTPAILVANLSTTVPQQIVQITRANPDWNTLFAPYDAAFVFILPALEAAGTSKDQRAYGFDPLEQNLTRIKAGNIQSATVAAPFSTIAYASTDQFNRLFAGKPVAAVDIKDKLIDAQNLPPEGVYLGESDAKSHYEGLWGVS